jgi:hypothetical protein
MANNSLPKIGIKNKNSLNFTSNSTRGAKMITAFNQLASVSAVLGGFAFVFLGALIATDRYSRPRLLTAALTTPSAACFILCALGWSLVTVWLGSPLRADTTELPDFLLEIHIFLSIIFMLGIGFFFASIGVCGWIYSRKLGWITTVVAIFAAVGAVFVVRPFIVWM